VAAIRYLKGDATSPQAAGAKIIAHVCNDIGKWGAGFVLAVSARWPEPEAEYRKWYAAGKGGGFELGAVQLVRVGPHTVVANMIGQQGIKTGSKGPPIRYPAVGQCLAKVGDAALLLGASVHMPRIGCGLAGGEWSRIEPLVREHLGDRGVPVAVYDFG
jgi:O-acetyl-ADP-ribose deacetylase (regulator of RNase III)